MDGIIWRFDNIRTKLLRSCQNVFGDCQRKIYAEFHCFACIFSFQPNENVSLFSSATMFLSKSAKRLFIFPLYSRLRITIDIRPKRSSRYQLHTSIISIAIYLFIRFYFIGKIVEWKILYDSRADNNIKLIFKVIVRSLYQVQNCTE